MGAHARLEEIYRISFQLTARPEALHRSFLYIEVSIFKRSRHVAVSD